MSVLLGVLVLSTSAVEPSERATNGNPFSYGYEPITAPYLYRIPVSISEESNSFSAVLNRNEFIGDDVGEFLHNYCWLSVSYEGQNENGDLELYTVRSVFADCLYLSNADTFDIYASDPIYSYITLERGRDVIFAISYADLPYPDSIVEAYVYIGLNPLRYGYDSNTSGGNTDEAYQEGYNNGLTEGYDNGYSDGYNTASSQIENNNNIKDLGEGFFNGLVETFLIVYQIPVFGTTLGEIIGYILTALIVLLLVKVVAFVV